MTRVEASHGPVMQVGCGKLTSVEIILAYSYILDFSIREKEHVSFQDFFLWKTYIAKVVIESFDMSGGGLKSAYSLRFTQIF